MCKKKKIIKGVILLTVLFFCIQLVSAKTIEIKLHKGWNVIPIPFQLERNGVEEVFSPIKDDIIIVRKYTEEGVTVYDPAIPFRFNTLKTIEPKFGYEIRMKKPGTLILTGNPIQDKTINLHKGWNCISHLLDETMPIENVLGPIKDKIVIVRKYTEEGVKVYDPAVPFRFNTLKEMEPGYGYQLKMKEDAELVFPILNEKNIEKYSEKQVFLISDKDWHDVLPLVPVTTWTGDEACQKGYFTADGVCVYPTLIYHEEESGFDADSIIYFMQQYSPNKVTILGETPQELDNLLIAEPELGVGLNENQVNKITINDYLSYWKSFRGVVYVEDNYELSLLASTYASLINSPLIIQGTALDTENVFDEKNVICVGNVNKNCNKKYNLEELQKKYVDKTKTDKMLLVNSDDLNLKIDEKFFPQKSKDPINNLYTKSSLSAPLLASAKHEIIISTTSINYPEVDNFIENKISSLNLNPKYLTIIASPNAIEMSYTWVRRSNYKRFVAADQWQYSKIDNDIFLDLAVGRIFSLTSSDVSSNIARSLFYDVTLKNKDKMLVTRGGPYVTTAADVYALGKVMSVIGYDTTVNPKSTTSEDWKNKFYISYNNHGFNTWAGIHSSEIPYLDNSFVITSACLTCAFKESTNNDGTYDRKAQKLFCSNIIRKGGVGYIGATDLSADFNKLGFTSEIFAQESTIGKAFMNAKNSNILWKGYVIDGSVDAEYNVMPWIVLLGDPTLKLKIVNKMPKPQLRLIEDKGDERKYKLVAPAMKINIPENVKNLCEYPKGVTPLYFTTVYNCQFDTYNKFSSRFAVIPNFDVVAAKVLNKKNYIVTDKQKQDNLWITIQSDYSNIDYFDSANEQGFTDSNFDISLFNKVPDLIIEKVSLLDHKLSFNVKNIGNKETGIIGLWIWIKTDVCVNERCSDFNYTTFTRLNVNYNNKPLFKRYCLKIETLI